MTDLSEIEGGASVHPTRVHSFSRRISLQLSRSRSSHAAPHYFKLVLARRSSSLSLQQQKVYYFLRVVTEKKFVDFRGCQHYFSDTLRTIKSLSKREGVILLRAEQLLDQLIALFEATKASDRLQHVGIDRVYGRNNVRLHHVHH